MSVLTSTQGQSISFEGEFFPTLKNICNCAFCGQLVFESRILRCIHSICNPCFKFISLLDAEDHNKNNLICPRCSVTTPISNGNQLKLPPNTIADEYTYWRAVEKKLEMRVNCFNLSHPLSTAIYYCLTCTLFMCKSDMITHNSSLQSDSHKVLSIKKLQHQLYSENIPGRFLILCCEHHLFNHIVSYDELNNQLLCQKCIEINYQNEKQLPIHIILSSKLDELNHMGVLAYRKIAENERINLKLEEKLLSLKRNKMNFLDRISLSFKILRAKLDERESFLNNLVECNFSKQIRFLENIIRISNSKTNCLKFCRNFCNLMCKFTSSPNFLLSEKSITHRVQRIISAINEPSLSDFHNYSLSIFESALCGHIDEFGNFQRLPGYTSRHVNLISAPYLQKASITFDAQDDFFIGDCEVICILKPRIESSSGCSLKRMPLLSNFKKTTTSELNHIAICIETNQLITVYSQDNSVDIFGIQLENADETLSIIFLGSIKFKNPQGLCTFSTSVYICDCVNNLVRVYNLADNKFLMENRFGNSIINSPLDISISMNALLHILEKQPFIQVFSLEGIYIKRIEIFISCLQNSYKLIHCDKFNNILLSNVTKNSVDLFSANGVELWNTGSLITLSDDFSFITNLSDHLVICERGKIHFL